MLVELSEDERTALDSVVRQLEAGWNALDGAAFAAPFAEDADFVTVRGEHLRGRTAIAEGHAGIFRTIYAGSVNQYSTGSARLLRSDVALVHVQAALDVPGGPLAGKHAACFSLVLSKQRGAWEIASLHNTLVAAPGRA